MNSTISANMMKLFQECPKKFYLTYKEGITIPQNNSSSEKGKNLHALINYYLKGFNIDKIKKALSAEELQLWNNFLSLKIKPANLFESEYSFNVKIANKNTDRYWWLNGRIDAIIKSGEHYTIYDWKTGNIPENPQNDLQTQTYIFALDKILKQQKTATNINQIKFNYINLKTLAEYSLKADENYLTEASKNILNILNNIHYCTSSKKPATQEFQHKKKACTHCKFKSICESDVFL